MVTIKIEAKELTFEEADNMMESYLQNHGWACVVDTIHISNKKVFDITDKKDQKWLSYLMEMRGNRINRIKKLKSLSTSQSEGTELTLTDIKNKHKSRGASVTTTS